MFLCGTAGGLTTRSGLRTAIHRYNPSSSYVASVLALDQAYRANDAAALAGLSLGGTVGILTLLAPGGGAVRPGSAGSDRRDAARAPPAGGRIRLRLPGQHGRHGQHATDSASAGPGPGLRRRLGRRPDRRRRPGTTDPWYARPRCDDGPRTRSAVLRRTRRPRAPRTRRPRRAPVTHDPDPTPTRLRAPRPHRTPPRTRSGSPGVLTACGTGWCLGQLSLDVGDAAFLAATSSADFDADGAVESNSDELTGLAGTEVSLLVAPDAAPARVLSVNGVAYVGG